MDTREITELDVDPLGVVLAPNQVLLSFKNRDAQQAFKAALLVDEWRHRIGCIHFAVYDPIKEP